MWIVWASVPLVLFAVLVARGSRTRRAPLELFGCAVVGLLAAIPTCLLERWAASTLQVNPRDHVAGALAPAIASVILFTPLEEGAKLAATWQLFRAWSVNTPRRATLYATCVAVGFATVENGIYARDASVAGVLGSVGVVVLLTRELLSTAARLLAAAFWGFALGRAGARGRLDGVLFGTWTAAIIVRALCDHLVFGHGAAGVLAALPLYAGMLAVAYVGRQQFARRGREPSETSRSGLGYSAPAPTLADVRNALRRAESPIMLWWIPLGMLVTTGIMLCSVVAAVLLGRRLGLDFSAVDEGELTAAGPVALIGAGVLLAFPFAGFLTARASRASSVLEPALASALAIVGTLIMLGLAAPVAIIFALAFAPIAFGLACAGAWLGVTPRADPSSF